MSAGSIRKQAEISLHQRIPHATKEQVTLIRQYSMKVATGELSIYRAVQEITNV